MSGKRVRISSDGGTTWLSLPGSEAEFSSEAANVDDTILGQTFTSGMPGLESWKISSNGIFKGFAGYLAKVLKTGSTTAVTAEAFTLVSGKTYKINTVAKEIWDRSASLIIKDNGSAVAAANIESIDYLFGRVTFVASYTPTTPITADLSYFPTTQIGKGNSYSLTMTAAAKDESCFVDCQANGGYQINAAGLRGVTLQLQGIFAASTDAKADLAGRSEFIVEVDAAGDGKSIARGFFRYASVSQSGAVGAVEGETLNFVLSVPSDDKLYMPFTWYHRSGTLLHSSIQAAITSWLNELNTYDAQYLPTGVEASDGVEGNVVFTDISLSGGLNNMNIFNIEMTGNGAFTEV